MKRSIEAVKRQIRRRRFIIAIDETYEPFYGKIFSYVRYYKKRWGIETTFRVQDDA